MARQTTVILSKPAPKQEITSPVLADEEAAQQFEQIRAVQAAGGVERLALPWLSVRGGMIVAAHVEDARYPSLPSVAAWE